MRFWRTDNIFGKLSSPMTFVVFIMRSSIWIKKLRILTNKNLVAKLPIFMYVILVRQYLCNGKIGMQSERKLIICEKYVYFQTIFEHVLKKIKNYLNVFNLYLCPLITESMGDK